MLVSSLSMNAGSAKPQFRFTLCQVVPEYIEKYYLIRLFLKGGVFKLSLHSLAIEKEAIFPKQPFIQ